MLFLENMSSGLYCEIKKCVIIESVSNVLAYILDVQSLMESYRPGTFRRCQKHYEEPFPKINDTANW